MGRNLQHFFSEEEGLGAIEGYGERNVNWFKEQILPDFKDTIARLNLSGTLGDIGCAKGYFTRIYADLFDKVIGYDFAPKRIEEAIIYHSLPNIEYKQIDLANDPITDSLDCAVSSAVFQHIDPTNGDRVRAFQNVAKALGSGKYLILYDEKYELRPDNWTDFYQPLDPQWIRDNLGDIYDLQNVDFIARGNHGEYEFRWELLTK